MEIRNDLFQGEYPLTEEQIAFYRENGYVRCDKMFSMDEVEYLREGLSFAMEHRKGHFRDIGKTKEERETGGKDKILQMLNLWENYPVFQPFSHSKRLAGVASQLTGSDEIRIFHDQALVKEPNNLTPSPWHQDQPYWPTKDHSMLSIWVALDDVPIERGCMQFIPGSHKWGEMEPVSFTGDGEQYKNMIDKQYHDQWKPVAVPLKAGDCTWHNGLTFHYTRANETDHIRRALTIIFIPNDVHFAAEEKMEHLLSPTITSKKGELLRGTSFVQVY